MTLAEKLQLLRNLEGNLRGLDRSLSKSEVSRLIRQELGVSLSQAYLSQLESGKREHMTAKSRDLLARFYKVHPGYLVSDPEGYAANLVTSHVAEVKLDDWVLEGAQMFTTRDPELSDALREMAFSGISREALMLAANLAENPQAIARLRDALADHAEAPAAPPKHGAGNGRKGRKQQNRGNG